MTTGMDLTGETTMKTLDQINQEIEALKRLALTAPDDAIAQASIAGQINALEWLKQLPDYKAFALWCLTEGPFSGCDLDGGSVQETALRYGLIKQVPYDPAVHGDNDCDLEPGDPWFVPVNG